MSISNWSLRKEDAKMDSRTTPSKNVLDHIRKRYPVGSLVRLVAMDDPHSELKPGACGRVDFIDDTGTISVDWDSGSGLGVVYGVDRIELLDEKNYLKNAELDIEGEEAGYGMIDGIINNVPKDAEKERGKPSVLDRLTQDAPEAAKPARVPVNSEREL
jgi:hypothetical protein